MKTIILSGFSIKNKDWAYAVKYNLPEEEMIVHEWFHWITESDTDFDAEQEVQRLKLKEEINIIAKSIGTLVAVKMLEKKYKIKKAILCGIPLNDLDGQDFSDYQILKNQDLDRYK